MENPDLSIEETLQRVVDRLPAGWQYPDVCRARITYRGAICETAGFAQTRWVQRANIFTGGTLAGSVEVAYPPGRPTR